MTSVSAVIITFNEAHNIARCLNALSGLVDEIIVVDSFSTDGTKKICESFEVQFYQREWEGYAPTKNWANAQASHNYIFSIDADEEIDKELAKSLTQARTTGLAGVYEVNRKTNYCGHWVKHSGWYPDRKIRLFPKSSARWTGDFVHETLEVNAELSTHRLEGHLHHYSYHSLQDHATRAEKYAGLHAQKMAAEGKRTSIFKASASAFWKFLQSYIINLGFLDGWAGWQIARFSARAVFLKHKKLLQLYIKQSHEDNR